MTQRLTPYARLERAVRPWVQIEDLDIAIRKCEAHLETLRHTEYHSAIQRSWLQQTKDLARWIAGFYRTSAKAMSVHAIYCEMNRFEINTNEWNLQAFAYDGFGTPEDLSWLVRWKKCSTNRGRFVLRDMSDLQALFARDYVDEPPMAIRSASEAVMLLLTLRMQELVHAAALHARQSGLIPDGIPVLSAAHDTDLVCISYGSIVPQVTMHYPNYPAAPRIPPKKTRLGIYQIDGGFDEFGNSLPWDVLDYARVSDSKACGDSLDTPAPLGDTWVAPRVTLRQRKWRCDLVNLYPHWAVNAKARDALETLLRGTVEFLPLRCTEFPQLWVLHPLRHVDLSSRAVHNAKYGNNMTAIRRYHFETVKLRGKHLFAVKQALGSPSRKAQHCYMANYVSEEFRQSVIMNGLKGVVFKEIFSYRAPT